MDCGLSGCAGKPLSTAIRHQARGQRLAIPCGEPVERIKCHQNMGKQAEIRLSDQGISHVEHKDTYHDVTFKETRFPERRSFGGNNRPAQPIMF